VQRYQWAPNTCRTSISGWPASRAKRYRIDKPSVPINNARRDGAGPARGIRQDDLETIGATIERIRARRW